MIFSSENISERYATSNNQHQATIKMILIFKDVNFCSRQPNQIKWRPTFGSRPWG